MKIRKTAKAKGKTKAKARKRDYAAKYAVLTRLIDNGDEDVFLESSDMALTTDVPAVFDNFKDAKEFMEREAQRLIDDWDDSPDIVAERTATGDSIEVTIPTSNGGELFCRAKVVAI